MIEYIKTLHSCGHVSYKGSTFGQSPEEAEKTARESGYLVEKTDSAPCKECVSRLGCEGEPETLAESADCMDGELHDREMED